MSDAAKDLNPLVADWAFLIGNWTGSGKGFYPTIADFAYEETLTFSAVPGKAFLRYEQKTANAAGAPMHMEIGFFRPQGEGVVEFVLAQQTGQTELLHGTTTVGPDGSLTLHFAESTVANTRSAKHVDSTQRKYVFSADRSAVETAFSMAAVGQSMHQHLESRLHKQSS